MENKNEIEKPNVNTVLLDKILEHGDKMKTIKNKKSKSKYKSQLELLKEFVNENCITIGFIFLLIIIMLIVIIIVNQ